MSKSTSRANCASGKRLQSQAAAVANATRVAQIVPIHLPNGGRHRCACAYRSRISDCGIGYRRRGTEKPPTGPGCEVHGAVPPELLRDGRVVQTCSWQ
ncbi:hypothetical protein MRX96_037939 [Rhipicephalus microplus]